MFPTLMLSAILVTQPADPLQRFSGSWSGEMASFGAEFPPIEMSLTVKPTEVEGDWTWWIQYGETDIRRYVIRAVDAESGLYEVDEKNSIVLPAQMFGGHTLISAFAIPPSRLIASYRVQGEELIFTVVTMNEAAEATTGGEGQVPEVLTVPATSMQRAVLRRRP
ncbi:MAG: hypothetical protein AAGB51_02165 [Planctomycetota bacterium]